MSTVSSRSEWFQEHSSEFQYLLGSPESKPPVESPQCALLWRAKFRIELGNPFGNLARFVEVSVRDPMRERPKHFDCGAFPSKRQFTPLVEDCEDSTIDLEMRKVCND